MARPLHGAAALLLVALLTPGFTAGQTVFQDAATFWKSMEASLLAPVAPFNLSAPWNPHQPTNISSHANSTAEPLAAPSVNTNPDNGNPKWKLPIPVNSSQPLAAAAVNVTSAAPLPTAIPPSQHASALPPVSAPSSAAVAQAAAAQAAAAQEVKDQQARLAAALAQAAKGPALPHPLPNITLPTHLPNATANNITLPGYFHPPTAAPGLRGAEQAPVQEPLSAQVPVAAHAAPPHTALPSQAAPSAAPIVHPAHPLPEASAPSPAAAIRGVGTRRLLLQEPAPAPAPVA